MKGMKLSQLINVSTCVLVAALFSASCKKLAGLPLQENQQHIVSTLDPHINMNAWEFLKSRALGTSAFKDSILYRMYQGIIYSGIDSAEYTKPGRTFILLHNDAVLRKSGTTTTADCYFGRYKVNGVAATKWE